LGGDIVPSWKTLLSIFSEELAQLLENVEPDGEIVSVSVSEHSETVLAILSAITEKKSIDDKIVTAANELGINLASDKNVMDQSYSRKGDITNICIVENQTKLVSYTSEDLLNVSDEKDEIHDNEIKNSIDTKSQIESEMLVKEEQDSAVKHIRVTPEKIRKSSLVCDVCKVKTGFQTRQAHQNHMLKLHKAQITCDQCNEEFTEFDAYKAHMYKVHGRGKMCSCPQCGIFVNKGSLQKHIFSKHTIMELQNCSNCEYVNKSVKEVERHFKRVHTETFITNCYFCGAMTKNLKRHLSMSQCDKKLEEKIVYPCDHCVKQFSMKRSLETHIKGIHENIKDQKCPDCSYCTYSRYNLRLHVNKVHLGKKLMKEKCVHCGKETYNISYHIKLYHTDK